MMRLILAIVLVVSGCSPQPCTLPSVRLPDTIDLAPHVNQPEAKTPESKTPRSLAVDQHYIIKYWDSGDIEEVKILKFSSTGGSVNFKLKEYLNCNCNDKWWPITRFEQAIVDEVK